MPAEFCCSRSCITSFLGLVWRSILNPLIDVTSLKPPYSTHLEHRDLRLGSQFVEREDFIHTGFHGSTTYGHLPLCQNLQIIPIACDMASMPAIFKVP